MAKFTVTVDTPSTLSTYYEVQAKDEAEAALKTINWLKIGDHREPPGIVFMGDDTEYGNRSYVADVEKYL